MDRLQRIKLREKNKEKMIQKRMEKTIINKLQSNFSNGSRGIEMRRDLVPQTEIRGVQSNEHIPLYP